MQTINDLEQRLRRIDGKGYRAYKEIAGAYRVNPCTTLFLDHIQGDPFASPSKVRVRVDMAASGFPESLRDTSLRRMALADFLAREMRFVLKSSNSRCGSGKSGLMQIDAGNQEVLERSAVVIRAAFVEARLEVGLPAAGRRVLGREAKTLLCELLPECARSALLWCNIPQKKARIFVDCVDNQEHLRSQLQKAGLVAFVADGSVLPRESGVSDRPMKDAVPFKSPESLRVTLPLKHPVTTSQGLCESLTGMGIPEGITLIVGGGYHGKSTLLRALERGVYPHVPGDGREYVVSDFASVKIRAEDGRSISHTDISVFIDNLPLGRDTQRFYSDDASGSTSQAANIIEAVEVGARCLLLDEDTSATNFMIRDSRMQALVAAAQEPITPFLDRVTGLYEHHGISSILVMGGCGDYFDVAHRVVQMCAYKPEDVTARVAEIRDAMPVARQQQTMASLSLSARCPDPRSLDASRGRRDVKIQARARDLISFGEQDLHLRYLEQLVDTSQTRAIGYGLYLMVERWMDGKKGVAELCELLSETLDREGLDVLDPYRRGDQHPGNFARPRKFEVAAALNRMRSLRFR